MTPRRLPTAHLSKSSSHRNQKSTKSHCSYITYWPSVRPMCHFICSPNTHGRLKPTQGLHLSFYVTSNTSWTPSTKRYPLLLGDKLHTPKRQNRKTRDMPRVNCLFTHRLLLQLRDTNTSSSFQIGTTILSCGRPQRTFIRKESDGSVSSEL